MRIQTKSGTKSSGHRCDGYPHGCLSEIDAAATRSLNGLGKNKMTPTYRKKRWNQSR